MTEMSKLYLMLCEEDIPCEVVKHWSGTNQLYYPTVEDNVCDVICFKGSYGYEKGLLEIMGLISDEVKDYDDVEGYLTAKEVFKRIKSTIKKINKKIRLNKKSSVFFLFTIYSYLF